MNLKALAKADLNLLVALYVLLEERSVSAAAKRLSITQPAMSKTLARLRNTFDDPLFVRSKRGVHPTPRAESVGAELKPLLSKIETLLHGEDFTPVSYRGEIQIAISEYVGISLLPTLSAKLQQLAPKLRLKTNCTSSPRGISILLFNSVDGTTQKNIDINHWEIHLLVFLSGATIP